MEVVGVEGGDTQGTQEEYGSTAAWVEPRGADTAPVSPLRRAGDGRADAVRTTSGTVSSGDEYDNIGQYGLGYYSVVDGIGNNKVGREV